MKAYSVQFAHTAVGRHARPVARALVQLLNDHGPNWPVVRLVDDDFQVRDVVRTGRVWQGTFARLRSDAPHRVDAQDNEQPLDLQPGDRLIDKCHFMYREHHNVLVWQVNRNAGVLTRFAAYMSTALTEVVTFPLILNSERLEQVLDGHVKELQFDFARPHNIEALAGDRWSQATMDLLTGADAAKLRCKLVAPRGGWMRFAPQRIRQLVNAANSSKIKVRLTEETDLVDLMLSPLKERIEVPLVGLYPHAPDVFAALEAAYDRQRERIALHRGAPD